MSEAKVTLDAKVKGDGGIADDERRIEGRCAIAAATNGHSTESLVVRGGSRLDLLTMVSVLAGYVKKVLAKDRDERTARLMVLAAVNVAMSEGGRA